MPLGSCLSVHLRLLRVAHRVVQQGHLRVRKLEKFLDGGNVHRHARTGHQAHAGTEQINILAHDASIGSHRHLRAGVAAAELGLVCNDEASSYGMIFPCFLSASRYCLLGGHSTTRPPEFSSGIGNFALRSLQTSVMFL